MSLLFLGNGREEDQLLLDSLGLQSLHNIGFNTEFYFRESGFVLALLIGVVIFVKENFTDHLLEDDRERSENLTIQLSFPVYMILVLFLPRAISIFLLLVNVVEVLGIFVIILLLIVIGNIMEQSKSRHANTSNVP